MRVRTYAQVKLYNTVITRKNICEVHTITNGVHRRREYKNVSPASIGRVRSWALRNMALKFRPHWTMLGWVATEGKYAHEK